MEDNKITITIYLIRGKWIYGTDDTGRRLKVDLPDALRGHIHTGNRLTITRTAPSAP